MSTPEERREQLQQLVCELANLNTEIGAAEERLAKLKAEAQKSYLKANGELNSNNEKEKNDGN